MRGCRGYCLRVNTADPRMKKMEFNKQASRRKAKVPPRPKPAEPAKPDLMTLREEEKEETPPEPSPEDSETEYLALSTKKTRRESLLQKGVDQAEQYLSELPGEDEGAQKLQQELAARALCHRKLIPFILRFDKSYTPGWAHHDIAARLEKFSDDVAAKRSPRLILELPPRHGKSTLASHYLPPWHLGRHPEHEMITTSHTATLAEKFSRKNRELLRTKLYKSVFPDTELDKQSQSVQQWNTTKGGGLLAAGVGGGILGSGAHCLIIDDPVKNAEEAQSEGTKESIWEWYATVAYTRLAPGGGVLIIMQRWDGMDLAGMLQKKAEAGEGDEFEVVRYPAIAEEDERFRKKGEALHPDRYPLERLEAIRNTMDDWMWSALFQQRPVKEEGSYFTKDMIVLYDDKDLPAEEELTYYGTWDFAISQKQRADWTVGFSAGVDRHGNIWLVDRVRERMDAFEIAEAILQMWEDRPHDMMAGEQGQIKLAIGPYLEREAEDRGLYDFQLEELSTGRKDKVQRARSIQGMMRRGKVRIPKNAPWRSELVSELLAFPNGEFDDQVDALAHLGLLLQDLQYNDRRPRSPRRDESGWRKKLRELMSADSGGKNWMGA